VGGGFSFDWDLVQSQAAKFTRVCTYDVSGTAWSDAGPSLTCSGRVNEIHAALEKAGVEGPYVLVGLSMGAVVARRYAREYPDETAGMVIVDHAFLNPADKPPAHPPPGPDQPPVLIYQAPIILTVEDTSNFNNLPARDQELHRWATSLGPALPTAEMAEACLAEVPATLGKMPLAVVSTGNALPNYLKLQTELLALSTDSTQFIADRSFHSVEIDQPEVVVRAIQKVMAR
jgi:pimeloyl-ACP methyl ester carboxylesterase